MSASLLVAGLFGLALGAGLLLVASPKLWPLGEGAHKRPRALDIIDERLVLAGLGTIGPVHLLLASALLGLIVGAVALALVPVLAIAAAAACAAASLPLAIVTWRARTRRRGNRALWPDVVDHLVSAVRSGMSLPDGLAMLAHVGPAAVRPSFAAFARDYEANANFSRSLDTLKQRLADPIADRILETLRMSREIGGSELGSVLRDLSAYLRQDAAIRNEVEARQSWVVNAARLGAVAPWIVLVLLAARPEAALAYNSAAGVGLIFAGLIVTIVAYRLMIALGRLPEERRWFQ